jgi:uncharacterized protein (DUF1330 family)
MKVMTLALVMMSFATFAQAQGTKKAYLVAELDVTDAPAFQAYGGKAAESMKPYNGHILARGKPTNAEGNTPQTTSVIVVFDSMADAKKWWNSTEYQALIPARQNASKAHQIYFIEGLE